MASKKGKGSALPPGMSTTDPKEYLDALGITTDAEYMYVQQILRMFTDPILRDYLAESGDPLEFLKICRVEVQRAFIRLERVLPPAVKAFITSPRQLTIALYELLEFLRHFDYTWLYPIPPSDFSLPPVQSIHSPTRPPQSLPIPISIAVRPHAGKTLPGSSLTIPGARFSPYNLTSAGSSNCLAIPAHLFPGSAQQAIAFDIIGPPPPNSPAGFVAQATADR
jgi:hypothetical protein